jgi:hypothetical protein
MYIWYQSRRGRKMDKEDICIRMEKCSAREAEGYHCHVHDWVGGKYLQKREGKRYKKEFLIRGPSVNNGGKGDISTDSTEKTTKKNEINLV